MRVEGRLDDLIIARPASANQVRTIQLHHTVVRGDPAVAPDVELVVIEGPLAQDRCHVRVMRATQVDVCQDRYERVERDAVALHVKSLQPPAVRR